MTLEDIITRDEAASQRISQWSGNRFVFGIAWLIARTGDTVFWLAVSAILVWMQHTLGWSLLITIAVTALLTAVAKGIFKRQRPSEKWAISTDKYAFPSGHAARAGAVAVTLAFAFLQWSVVCFLWALLVALARVILARHYLTDVVSGLVFGVLIGIAIQFFFNVG
jgi:membrane-associated phospholipid phosphatase